MVLCFYSMFGTKIWHSTTSMFVLYSSYTFSLDRAIDSDHDPANRDVAGVITMSGIKTRLLQNLLSLPPTTAPTPATSRRELESGMSKHLAGLIFLRRCVIVLLLPLLSLTSMFSVSKTLLQVSMSITSTTTILSVMRLGGFDTCELGTVCALLMLAIDCSL